MCHKADTDVMERDYSDYVNEISPVTKFHSKWIVTIFEPYEKYFVKKFRILVLSGRLTTRFAGTSLYNCLSILLYHNNNAVLFNTQ